MEISSLKTLFSKATIAGPCSLKIGVQLMKFASNHKKKYLHLEDEPKKTKSVTG